MTSLKLLVDIDALVPPLTGIGHYIFQLVKGLQHSEQVNELKLIRGGNIVGPDFIDELENKAQLASKSIRTLPFRPILRWGYQQYRIARFHQNSAGLEDFIYHAPSYFLMPFAGHSVVTIHDLSFIRYPEFHPSDRVNYWRKNIRQIVNRANHIITDSEFQSRELIELLDVPAEKISAVSLGVADHFRCYTEDDCSAVLAEHGLKFKQFSLVVATVEPRKNFERILGAFEALPDALKYEYPLVIVGDKGWLSKNIHRAINRLVEKNQAYRLGYVPDEKLWRIYSSATVFVYPSLYEGFGLPVLEAMASGTAVLSSNSSSLPEVAGHACVLVDPCSVDNMAEEWHRLLTDEIKRKHHVSLGLERARMFTWDKCVDETLNVYTLLQNRK